MAKQDRKVIERKARLESGYPTDGLTFGQRLRKLRGFKRWSQGRLGMQIRPRMSGNFISDIERGKSSPSLDRIDSIATALGVDSLFLTHGYEPCEGNAPLLRDILDRISTKAVEPLVGPAVGPVSVAGAAVVSDDAIFQQPVAPSPNAIDIPVDNGDPTFRVKVQREGTAVILSFYFDQ